MWCMFSELYCWAERCLAEKMFVVTVLRLWMILNLMGELIHNVCDLPWPYYLSKSSCFQFENEKLFKRSQ